ncbi:MAG: CDP-alcohol phosphatidyltransferase family protein [Rhodomicrobium sp.]
MSKKPGTTSDRDRRQASGRIDRAASLLPNVLTLLAVFCGLTSIRLSGEGEPGLAMAAIFGAAVLDVADGFAARRLSVASAIGAQLDSLADFLNFGAAPAMLLYWTGLHLLGDAGWLIAGGYVLATGFRLARFNVQLQESREGAKEKWFRGLPSTGAAIGVLIADGAANIAVPPGDAAFIMATAMIGASALMLSTLKVPSLPVLFRRDGSGSRDG